jgi:hypothetical protein
VTKFRDIREKQVYHFGFRRGAGEGFVLGWLLATFGWLMLMFVAK